MVSQVGSMCQNREKKYTDSSLVTVVIVQCLIDSTLYDLSAASSLPFLTIADQRGNWSWLLPSNKTDTVLDVLLVFVWNQTTRWLASESFLFSFNLFSLNKHHVHHQNPIVLVVVVVVVRSNRETRKIEQKKTWKQGNWFNTTNYIVYHLNH